jgi:serine phosphatase RsbU (regulator of sigma subunit)
VLAQLHQGIYNALGHGSNQTQDGMDIALAAIDRKAGQVFFAGAKNGLAYAQKGEIHLLPADRKPIGGRQRDPEEVRSFAQHQIPIEKGMRLYLFSDGYQDQFGGPEGRKLMSRSFYALLQESASLPIGQQGERLRQAFQQWKGQQEQIDDVLVLGIEL